jgi:hypothetical protein
MSRKSRIFVVLLILSSSFIIGGILRFLDLSGIIVITKGEWTTFIIALVSFFGSSVIGAVSFWQTQIANRMSKAALELSTSESQRQILPYFSFRIMRYITSARYIKEYIEASAEEKEQMNAEQPKFVLPHALYITITSLNSDSNDNMSVSCSLSKKQENSIHTYGTKISDDGVIILGPMPYVQFQLTNVGRGSAIDLEICFVRKNKEEEYINEFFTVLPEETLDIGLYFDLELPNHTVFDFVFIVKYKNIYGRLYCQHTSLKIGKEEDNHIRCTMDNFMQKEVSSK